MNGHQPAVEQSERRYRRVAIIWIVIAIILAIGLVVFCVLAADWLFDFSGGDELMKSAYELANDALDEAEAARRRRRQLRRPWWRRDVG